MATPTQFNVRLPDGLANRVRRDARKFGKTLDAVSAIIFKDFFTAFTVKEREQFYRGAAVKRSGRKVKA
jgi:hypothetical protein